MGRKWKPETEMAVILVWATIKMSTDSIDYDQWKFSFPPSSRGYNRELQYGGSGEDSWAPNRQLFIFSSGQKQEEASS